MRGLLTLEEGTILVQLARKSITVFLKEQCLPDLPDTDSKVLQEPRSVFVTLKKASQRNPEHPTLRGCIGWLQPTLTPNTPSLTLLEATQRASVSSAIRDPRFPPVQSPELKEIIIEVSILTIPEELTEPSREKLAKHISIGVDGLIVESGPNTGLLLPQVAPEQGWNAEQFLKGCCRKAGLSPDRYLDPLVKVSKFQAQIFTESSPRSEIVERKF